MKEIHLVTWKANPMTSEVFASIVGEESAEVALIVVSCRHALEVVLMLSRRNSKRRWQKRERRIKQWHAASILEFHDSK